MNYQLYYDLLRFSKLVVDAFSPLFVYYTTHKVMSSYQLHRDFRTKTISDVNLPLDVKKKYTDVEISQISLEKVREVVLEFANVLMKEFPEDVLTNFYNNINEVTIKKNMGILFLSAYGTYICNQNKINYSKFSSLYHELFHMASSVFDDERKFAYVGFRQGYLTVEGVLKFKNIGNGINEGYTQLLTHRYFGDKHKITDSYHFEVSVVEKLEKIVGQDEMERLYLTADLNGLIEKLKQYASEEDILNFISSVDLISFHSDELFFFSNKKMKISLIRIYTFLLKAYMTKLKEQVNQGSITHNEFVQQANEYIKSLGTSVKMGGHRYNYFPEDELLNLLRTFASNQKIVQDSNEISELHRK